MTYIPDGDGGNCRTTYATFDVRSTCTTKIAYMHTYIYTDVKRLLNEEIIYFSITVRSVSVNAFILHFLRDVDLLLLPKKANSFPILPTYTTL
jgi:hypothetical protein